MTQNIHVSYMHYTIVPLIYKLDSTPNRIILNNLTTSVVIYSVFHQILCHLQQTKGSVSTLTSTVIWWSVSHEAWSGRWSLLPWELWLSRAEERVTRADRRDVPSLSELSVCSRSVEKSESSVPSELLPAFLCNTIDPDISIAAFIL